MAAGRFPPERLHRHAAEREQLVRQPRVPHRHDRLGRQAVGNRGARRNRHHPARRLAVRPQPEGRGIDRQRAITVRQSNAAALGEDEQVLILYEQPVTALDRRLGAALGGRERGAEDVAIEGQVDGERRGHASASVHHG